MEMKPPMQVGRSRPVQAWEDCPKRLYHRTFRDPAFAILEEGFIPGFGTANIHNFCSNETVEKGQHKAGIRADRHIEVCVSTKDALEYAWIFRSKSDGFLCREVVPGQCILYIRDTRTDTILWAREEAAEDTSAERARSMEGEAPEKAPRREEAGTSSSPTATTSPRPKLLQAHPKSILKKNKMLPPGPEGEDQVTIPATPVTVKFEGSGSITAEVGNLLALTDADRDKAAEERRAGRKEAPRARRLARIACGRCGVLRLEGQHVCFSCGAGVNQKSSQQTLRTFLAASRESIYQSAASELGINVTELCSADLRSSQAGWEADIRGGLSFGAHAIENARKWVKLHKKHGFHGSAEKFDNVDEYALKSLKAGRSRRMCCVDDCLVNAYLPSAGRSWEQRTLGYGSRAGNRGDANSLARLTFFTASADDMVAANLIAQHKDPPFAIEWLGTFLNTSDFVKVCTSTNALKMWKSLIRRSGISRSG